MGKCGIEEKDCYQQRAYYLSSILKKTWEIIVRPVEWQILIIFILAVSAMFYLFYSSIENHFMFYPQRHFDFSPEFYNLSYRDVFFHAEDGVELHGWFFPVEKEKPVILFFHGNAGNISHRLDNIRYLLERGFQVFIFDYRGYGKSSGRPFEKGVYMDGRAAYEWLVEEEQIEPENIILFGRSLGGAVAIDVAAYRRAGAMIIESPFLSTREMAKTMFPFSLLSPVLPASYNNFEKIKDISVPLLVIHGDNDDIVPFSMGEKLYESAKDPKFFYSVKGAGHNDTYIMGGAEYFDVIERFITDRKL